MGRALLVFLFGCLLFAQGAHARRAYFGIVGPGEGMGSFGHGFLVFQDEEPILLAKVMAYVLWNSKDDISEARQKLEIAVDYAGLKVEENVLSTLFSYYTKTENRYIALFELNMSRSEIDRLEELANRDKERPEEFGSKGYGLFLNCVTRPLELINQVVTPERKIELFSRTEVAGFSPMLLFGTESKLLSRFPYYLSKKLLNHPLSKGLTHLFPREEVRFIESFRDSIHVLDRLGPKCRWKEVTSEIVKSHVTLYFHDPITFDLLNLKTLVEKTCRNRHVKIDFLELLNLIAKSISMKSPDAYRAILSWSREVAQWEN